MVGMLTRVGECALGRCEVSSSEDWILRPGIWGKQDCCKHSISVTALCLWLGLVGELVVCRSSSN